MGGGLPVVPVYDLKIKGADLVAGNARPLLLDLRRYHAAASARRRAKGDVASLSRARRSAPSCISGRCERLRPSGVTFAVAFGIGGGIRTFRRPDGTSGREYLDVGENPPNGAIVYYWLDDGVSRPGDAHVPGHLGTTIASFRSDDKRCWRRGGRRSRAGLNRYVWDHAHIRGRRRKIDSSLAPSSNKPLMPEGRSADRARPWCRADTAWR